jgi:peptidoglycan/xylan/chitin deacetylase (PgdA/CDA1 family)
LPLEPNEWDVSDVNISDVDESRKLIALTFDDAPSNRMESILSVFAEFNECNPDCKASATIFYNGIRFDEQTPHLLASALALGFELGNHGYSHSDLTKLPTEELLKEIEATDKLLALADKKPTHLFRAPFGKTDERIKLLVPAPLINWTIDTLDWTGVSDDTILESVLTGCFSGAIVLMHDGYPQTVNALKRLLPALKEKGYQAVSVSKLIKAHRCVFYRGKEYVRARKL